eukprot:CAMPEP_0170653812 /NCGR_PEP_ID=MMETSP0224-20130122/47599_1 /TAXON_ID=285029 /ORGANISM="Togula jolla, Strain CCCM 725" /LENGTH=43 /DNA_ID= /DNA_START= /DNA_END= /DNA_ORIENTATION=
MLRCYDADNAEDAGDAAQTQVFEISRLTSISISLASMASPISG